MNIKYQKGFFSLDGFFLQTVLAPGEREILLPLPVLASLAGPGRFQECSGSLHEVEGIGLNLLNMGSERKRPVVQVARQVDQFFGPQETHQPTKKAKNLLLVPTT